MVEQEKKTINEYVVYLGWSRNELSRRADISTVTAQKAIAGGPNLSFKTKRDICVALTEAMHQAVRVGDVKW